MAPDGRRGTRVRTGTAGCAWTETAYDAASRPAHHSTAVSRVTKACAADHLPRPARVGRGRGGVVVGRHEAERLVHPELGRGHRGQQGPPGHVAPEDQHARAEDHGGDERQAGSGGHGHRRPRCGPWWRR